jgi:hypothetical protein
MTMKPLGGQLGEDAPKPIGGILMSALLVVADGSLGYAFGLESRRRGK